MSNKLERALYGPSWTEVILGAVLSVAIGGLLAAAYLVTKPVTQVKELPKEPVAGMVYYIEGSHDAGRARSLASKRKALLLGGSVALSEDELNIAAMPATPPVVPGKTPPPEPGGLLTAGALNIRLHDGAMQVSVPVRVHSSLLGLDTTFLIVSTGNFAKDGNRYVYDPATVYLGSCPVQRLPMISGVVLGRLLGESRFPTELVEAWDRLSEVKIDGSTLRLTMPSS